MNLTSSHITALAQTCHTTAKNHGFWEDAEDPSSTSRKLAFTAMAISRMSRQIEAMRKGEPYPGFPDLERIPNPSRWECLSPEQITILSKLVLVVSEIGEAIDVVLDGEGNLGEELADTHIRLFDLEGHLGLDSGMEIVTKAVINETRPFRHNKLA